MPRITKITTRRGDDGFTDMADGGRIRKDSRRIEAVGSLDELSSVIGMARAEKPLPETDARLQEIQNDLFCLGAMLASGTRKAPSPMLDANRIAVLERETAKIAEQLGPLENFLLPGGSPCAASLHFARAVCRRAERNVIAFSRSAKVESVICIYLNRLSDVLFQYARMENNAAGLAESSWKSR
jgi:cob(I)alamin adenosyltransferase